MVSFEKYFVLSRSLKTFGILRKFSLFICTLSSPLDVSFTENPSLSSSSSKLLLPSMSWLNESNFFLVWVTSVKGSHQSLCDLFMGNALNKRIHSNVITLKSYYHWKQYFWPIFGYKTLFLPRRLYLEIISHPCHLQSHLNHLPRWISGNLHPSVHLLLLSLCPSFFWDLRYVIPFRLSLCSATVFWVRTLISLYAFCYFW